MTTPYFFGYGSLVNRATHAYNSAHPAKINGWRRVWRHVEGREVAFLTAVPDAQSEIDGLIAEVPGGDWRALDAREAWYKREPTHAVSHALAESVQTHIYHAPKTMHRPASTLHPILLSYLDVVVQGYAQVFGADGVASFFDTTDGWDAPVKDDRANPIYPRHQALTRTQMAFVEEQLVRLNVRRI